MKFFISTNLHHYLRNLTTAQINLKSAFRILHSSSHELILIAPYTAVILVVIFTYKNHRFSHVLEVYSEEIRQGLQCLALHQVLSIVILDVHYVALRKEDVIVLLIDGHT